MPIEQPKPKPPGYKELAFLLRDRIVRGEFTNGKLPSEDYIRQEYDVSRAVVSKAKRLLEVAGLIETKGTARPVVRERPEPEVVRLTSACRIRVRPLTLEELESDAVPIWASVVVVQCPGQPDDTYRSDLTEFELVAADDDGSANANPA